MSSYRKQLTYPKISIAFVILFLTSVSNALRIQSISGDKVSLPCETTHWDENEVLLILWYRANSATPFYRVDSRNRILYKARHILVDHQLKNRFYFDIKSNPPVLKINPVSLEDEGEYRCRVDYKKSRTQTFEVSLKVIGPPKEVRITDINGQNLKGVIGPYDEYSNVLLICEAKYGSPNPSLIWYHINVLEVIIDDSYSVNPNGIVRNELNLRKLDRNDLMSKLTCRASSNGLYEPITSSVTIDMNLKPLNVVILTPNRPIIAGKLAQYRCRSDGSRPSAEISWVIDSETLSDVQNSVLHEGNSTLSVVSFVPHIEYNAKQLKCRAINQHMPDSTLEDKIVLEVYFSPQLEIVLKSNFQQISEGQEIQIHCQIISNPSIDEISWIFEGKTLTTSENSYLINSNQTLVLKNLNRNQSGKYHCMASNSIGKTISDELIISVKFSPVCKFGQKLYYNVIRNLVNKIKCSVESDPDVNLKFKWFANTSIEMFELKSFDSNLTTSIANYRPKTIMNNVLLSCYAQNNIGIQREPCLYRLKIENGPPESVRNCEITNRSLTILSVQCSPGNNGGLQQTFHLEVYISSSQKLHSNHSSSQPMFIINNLMPRIQYNLVIYSSNSKGRSNAITYNSVMIWSHERNDAKVISSVTNSFIGIVASVVIVFICVVTIIRIRSFIYEDEYKIKSVKTRSQPKNESNIEDSDENDETDEQNLMKDDMKNVNTKVESPSRLSAFKRLTNRLKTTKTKTLDVTEKEVYKRVPDIEKSKKIVTFAEFDELSESNGNNSREKLDYSSTDGKKNEEIVGDNNSKTDYSHKHDENDEFDDEFYEKQYIFDIKLRNTL